MSHKQESRKGKRAKGITLLGVPVSESLKSDIKRLAEKSGMTSAAWVRFKLQELVRRSHAASRAVAAGGAS